jgi:hypothetical protein
MNYTEKLLQQWRQEMLDYLEEKETDDEDTDKLERLLCDERGVPVSEGS